MGSRRKARECALQMLFAADVSGTRADELVRTYWTELGDADVEETAREFATRLATGTLSHLQELDERIKSRAEHWRIARMAVVDRNILRLAVYEFLHEPTPRTVAINEALEIETYILPLDIYIKASITRVSLRLLSYKDLSNTELNVL